MKKVRSLAAALVLILSIRVVPIHASAIEISPQWDNTSRVSCDVTISGNTASCKGTVTGYPGTTAINGLLTLYKQSGSDWDYVGSWSGSTAAATLTTSGSAAVKSGSYYKAVYIATVYKDGVWESVQTERSIKYCA